MPIQANDLWQICILTDADENITMIINKNKSVEDLFKKFRAKRQVFLEEQRLTFLVSEGTELQENDQRRLVDVDELRHKCTIRLIVYADGGVWPTEIEIWTQVRNPNDVPSLAGKITDNLSDIMGLDDDTPRVKMSCGHAIAPSSLALHCFYELKKGADLIRCPDPGCDTVWSFKSVIHSACLSSNETCKFERRMISNRLLVQSNVIKQCPGCKIYCRRLNENNRRIHCRTCTSKKGGNFYFCWSCQKEWKNNSSTELCDNLGCGDYKLLFECLATCETKILNGIKCPSRRACPKCLMLIEHTEKCKHMKCRNVNCKYEFCFICLQHYQCEIPHDPLCKLAPRQQPTSSRSSSFSSLSPLSPRPSRPPLSATAPSSPSPTLPPPPSTTDPFPSFTTPSPSPTPPPTSPCTRQQPTSSRSSPRPSISSLSSPRPSFSPLSPLYPSLYLESFPCETLYEPPSCKIAPRQQPTSSRSFPSSPLSSLYPCPRPPPPPPSSAPPPTSQNGPCTIQ